MFFKFKPLDGPSRYTFVDPDTGREFEEKTRDALVTRIKEYRSANNLEPIEYLHLVLENHWCHEPENLGRCTPIEKLPRGALGYIKGGLAVLKTVLYKSFAKQEVADERSEQCAGCKYNHIPENGGFEGWTNRVAEVATEGKISKHHDKLGQCAVCSCILKAKVFYNGRIDIEPGWKDRMEEVNCWQLGKGK